MGSMNSMTAKKVSQQQQLSQDQHKAVLSVVTKETDQKCVNNGYTFLRTLGQP